MIDLTELTDAAQKAFPADQLRPERDASWSLIAEMGWLMVPLSEESGGLGLGPDAVATLHFEMGRILSRAPLIPALATIQALEASELPNKADWLERAAAGAFLTLSLAPAPLAATGQTLSGTLPAVADADIATHILVTAPGLAALVPTDAPGVSLTERPLWDETRRLFDLTLAGHLVDPALVVATGPAADTLAASLATNLQLALAADALGGASAALAITVDYLKTRKQFDRPLAMFQALKHRCANLKTQITAAEALLWARTSQPSPAAADIAAVKALACDTYAFTCQEMVQLHGGIGLTQEYNCHLFLKRAQLNLWLAGGSDALNEAAGRAALASFAA